MGIFRNDDDADRGPGGSDPAEGAKVVPLLPLRDIVVFPYMVVPLFVGRAKSIRALEEAMTSTPPGPSARSSSCCGCPTAR
jgi:hypothetical protein